MAPNLRGFLSRKVKRDLIISFILGSMGSVAYQYGVVEPHRKRYEDFYKTYDAEADFERMKNTGVFNSV